MRKISFDIASGTVCGAEHLGTRGVPAQSINQDATYIVTIRDTLIAVVSDGCSDRLDSGVGAALLCRFFAAAVEAHLPLIASDNHSEFVAQVQDEIVRRIRETCQLAAPCSSSSDAGVRKVADELFLCTLIGAIITPTTTIVIAAGDGVWTINGKKLKKLGPFPKNEPPYLGYLVRGNHTEKCKLEIITVVNTNMMDSVCIGSDGCAEIPDEILTRMLSQNATFTNPETLNRELRILNSEKASLQGQEEAFRMQISIKYSERVLTDDTTLIVIRKAIEKPVPMAPIETQTSVSNPLTAQSKQPSKQPGKQPGQRKGSWVGTIFGMGEDSDL